MSDTEQDTATKLTDEERALIMALADEELGRDEARRVAALRHSRPEWADFAASVQVVQDAAQAWRVDDSGFDVWPRLGLAEEPATISAARKAEIAAALQANRLPQVDLNRHPPESNALRVVPASLARQYHFVPVKKDGQTLWTAMSDPLNQEVCDKIRFASRCLVRPMYAPPEQIDAALEAAYGAASPASPQTEDTIGALLAEVRKLREEVNALREETGALREEAARLRRGAPASRPLPRLPLLTGGEQFPFWNGQRH